MYGYVIPTITMYVSDAALLPYACCTTFLLNFCSISVPGLSFFYFFLSYFIFCVHRRVQFHNTFLIDSNRISKYVHILKDQSTKFYSGAQCSYGTVCSFFRASFESYFFLSTFSSLFILRFLTAQREKSDVLVNDGKLYVMVNLLLYEFKIVEESKILLYTCGRNLKKRPQ